MSSSEEIELIMPSSDEFKDDDENNSKKNENKTTENNEKETKAISISIEELAYRQKHFCDLQVDGLKLMCTSCGKNLELNLSRTHRIASHPLLDVILCKGCAKFYGEGDFSVDEDGTDKYCRWCGQGGELYLCSECNFAFCRKCIKRNLNRSILKDVDSDDWKCFSCNSEPLWELRGICAATMKYIEESKRKRKEKRSLNKSLRKFYPFSSSEEEEEGEKTRKLKKRTLRCSPSIEKDKIKRLKKGDSNTCNSSKENDEKYVRYSTKVDRKTVLDSSWGEILISKIEEHASDFFELFQAISSESKKVLKKKKLSLQQMQNFKERYNFVKKLIEFRDLSCNSISQACENFILAYQHIIESYNNENCKNNVTVENQELHEGNNSVDGAVLADKQSERIVAEENEKVSDDSEADGKISKRANPKETNMVSDDSEAEENQPVRKDLKEKNQVSDNSEIKDSQSKRKDVKGKNIVLDSSEEERELSERKDAKEKILVSDDSEVKESQSKRKDVKGQSMASDDSDAEESQFKRKGPKNKNLVSDDSETEENKSKATVLEEKETIPNGGQSHGKKPSRNGPETKKAESGDSETENNERRRCNSGGKGTIFEVVDNQYKMDDTEIYDDEDDVNDCVNQGTEICKKQDKVIHYHENDNEKNNKSSEIDFSVSKVDSRVRVHDSLTNSQKAKCSEISGVSKTVLQINSKVKKTLQEIHVHGKIEQSKLDQSSSKHSSKKLAVERMDCETSKDSLEAKGSCRLVVKETSSEDSESDSEERTLIGAGKQEAHSKSNLNNVISNKRNANPVNNFSPIKNHDGSLSENDIESVFSPNMEPVTEELLEKEKMNGNSVTGKPEVFSEGGILTLDDVTCTLRQHVDNKMSSDKISKLGKAHEEKGNEVNSQRNMKVANLKRDENNDLSVDVSHKGDIQVNEKSDQINKDMLCEASDNEQNNVHGDESERKAMLSLLLSSSDDEISGKIGNNYSDYDSNVSEAESQESVSTNSAHQKKNKLETLFISNNLNLKEDINGLDKSAQCLEVSIEYPSVKKCSVEVEKLPLETFEKYFSESSNSLGSKTKESSETKTIERLVNLKTLDKSNKKITSDLKITSETDISSKSVLKKQVKKSDKDNKTLKDFHDIDSDGSSNHSPHEDDSDVSSSKQGRGLKNILEELNKKNNKLAKELLLMSSDSDESIGHCEEKKEKKNKSDVKKVEKVEKVVKKEKSDDDDTVHKEKKDESSDESDIILKKQSWRNNKLLKMKLSESDTSDDERRWNAKKLREAKEGKESESDDPQMMKKNRKSFKKRMIKLSDSDCELLDSESSDDDFQIISKVTNKRKRKDSSDTDRSKSNKSGSDSDKSQKKKPKRRRIRKPVSDSSDTDADGKQLTNSQKSDGTPGKGRKNIRKVLKDDDVVKETRRAAKEEEERRKRISEKQKLYDELYNIRERQSDTVDSLVLDFDAESKEELVKVDETLVKKLKPHQVKGVKFMWDACFESLERIKKSEGSGCILAHCMGLGKTLQVVALIHTLLSNSQTQMKTVMVVCPLSTVLNWVNEFSKWLDQLEDNDIEVFELTKCKQMYERVGVLKNWQRTGGVMIIGYNLYRTLTSNNARKNKRSRMAIEETLVDPGPDLVVCDEGHLLKNEGSALSKAMNRLRTRRRIVLTGTPLQNNLLEYHCMVQFVKPNLLGTKKEFLNRFVNPINNGQYENSTAHDVKVMKRRAHVLHKMLDSSVQRYDYSVLTPFLPPKFEYALSIRLTELQIKLYKYYLENFAASDGSAEASGGEGAKTKTATLFKDYQFLSKIWTHPRVLKMNSEKIEKKRLMESSDTEGSLRDFIDDDSSSNTSSDSDTDGAEQNSEKEEKKIKKPKTRSRKNESDSSEVDSGGESQTKNPEDWWRQFVTDEAVLDDLRESGKLSILFTLLDECEKLGEKLLVFSQSLFSLDLIEHFLQLIDEANQNKEKKDNLLGYTASWSIGLDYFRLDGSSTPENRSAWCKIFNREDNLRARLFLISTRAGGLGINLVAANRVVIFDASWNPSYDLQSIFRVYRFGQKKPCYIYRFLAQATMEEKIYNRQVSKLSLACRVVDEQQIERHYSLNDLKELYIFNPEEKVSKEIPLVPKDIVLAELVRQEDSWVLSYHEHDTLLENKEEEELNEEERKAAWEDYNQEKQGLRVNMDFEDTVIMNYLRAYGYTEHAIRDNIVKQNPQFTELEIQNQTSRVLRQLYAYISSESYQRQLQIHQLNRQTQPVYLQNPQMQPHTPVNMQHQYPEMSNMQHQFMQSMNIQSSSVQPMNKQPSSMPINPNSNLDRVMVKHKENLRNVTGTSANGSDNRIKVKSFGHVTNSSSAPLSGQTYNNPFSGVMHSQVGSSALRQQLTKKTVNPKNTTADVINLE